MRNSATVTAIKYSKLARDHFSHDFFVAPCEWKIQKACLSSSRHARRENNEIKSNDSRVNDSIVAEHWLTMWFAASPEFIDGWELFRRFFPFSCHSSGNSMSYVSISLTFDMKFRGWSRRKIRVKCKRFIQVWKSGTFEVSRGWCWHAKWNLWFSLNSNLRIFSTKVE